MTNTPKISARHRALSDPLTHRRGIALAVATLRLWLQRAAQRRALARLEAHRLRDIGITRQEADCEAGRPFWS